VLEAEPHAANVDSDDAIENLNRIFRNRLEVTFDARVGEENVDSAIAFDAAFKYRCVSSSLVTSAHIQLACFSPIALTESRNARSSMSTRRTFAPSSTNRLAAARPIPPEPPVIMATRPSSLPIFNASAVSHTSSSIDLAMQISEPDCPRWPSFDARSFCCYCCIDPGRVENDSSDLRSAPQTVDVAGRVPEVLA
jgi:hypothetical protein